MTNSFVTAEIDAAKTGLHGDYTSTTRVVDTLLDVRSLAADDEGLVELIDRTLASMPGRSVVTNAWLVESLDAIAQFDDGADRHLDPLPRLNQELRSMPEGHTIHRLARLQRPLLVGQRIATSSPQGRFAGGAELLDGQRVEDVEAFGKHLFYHWSDDNILHVHLGLFGKFRTFRKEPPPPTEGTRLAMQTDEATIYLAGPTACELLSPDERDDIIARLGPDPLRRGASSDAFGANLDRRSIAIASALLDQKVVAGVGNVYRAEILFLAGIDPHRRAHDLSDEERDRVWELARQELRRGEKAGRIVTVEPADVGGRRRSDLRGGERLYVYKRGGQPCHRCGTAIELGETANRKLWWCPSCQPS